ncbi:LysR substrate-binding domain-containing protein [Methylocella silvestris]|uniref:LysR family transcriptional regulator n=1 Tax=Methylocella silvestris TaxID=199596 RepID=A0A2J7TL13_METSI|nr:LysR substrate-binding domain-containing protein [Methylocella silvestris]PNG27455.1 LysR family transcriptional regulator [Methylocella silvestris]
MTLEQLRIFVAVAEREHVTAAARALNLTQSAASSAIAALEARYGTQLFDRIGRRIELTQAGRLFLGEARSVLSCAETAERALADIAGLRRGILSVKASQTIANYWLPRHLAAFQHAYPLVLLKLSIGNSAEVADAVEDGSADIGFLEGMVESRRIILSPVARDQMILIVPPQHEWMARATLGREDLVGARWVMREQGSGTRSAFEASLATLGVEPAALNVVVEMPSNESVRAAVEAGFGVSALSASVAAPSLEAGLLCEAPLRLGDRPFYEVASRERRRSQAAGALLGVIANAAAPAQMSSSSRKR